MYRIYFQLLFSVFIIANLNAQDTEKLFKYYEAVGNTLATLKNDWGVPIKVENKNYSSIYYYEVENADIEFSISDESVINAIFTVQPGNDDATSFTFYMIYGFKIENEGFNRIETTYDPDKISIDGRTQNFTKEYEIRDKFKKETVIINTSLKRSENNRLTFESNTLLDDEQIANEVWQKNTFNREVDYFKRISTEYDLLLEEWGPPNEKDLKGYDNSSIVKFNETEQYGYYAFLSKDNVIFKVIHLIQGDNNEMTEALYGEYSKIFKEAGYNYEEIPSDGFTIKALKYHKDGSTITHNLFPGPEKGKYPSQDVLTIETTVTK